MQSHPIAVMLIDNMKRRYVAYKVRHKPYATLCGVVGVCGHRQRDTPLQTRALVGLWLLRSIPCLLLCRHARPTRGGLTLRRRCWEDAARALRRFW